MRLYDRLFGAENPYDFAEGGSFLDNLNPNSLELALNAKIEPSLAEAGPGEFLQFERKGYFVADPDTSPEKRSMY